MGSLGPAEWCSLLLKPRSCTYHLSSYFLRFYNWKISYGACYRRNVNTKIYIFIELILCFKGPRRETKVAVSTKFGKSTLSRCLIFISVSQLIIKSFLNSTQLLSDSRFCWSNKFFNYEVWRYLFALFQNLKMPTVPCAIMCSSDMDVDQSEVNIELMDQLNLNIMDRN